MKSVVASLGLMATVANAYNYPRHHMHFPRSNGTDAGQTTLTVIATEVHTITSCAPTVTNCPARDSSALASMPASDLTTAVVTNTVVLTEIVCPVTEAAAVSKSIISKHASGEITGVTLTAPMTASVPAATSIPMSTGYSYPENPAAPPTAPQMPSNAVSGSSGESTDVPGEETKPSMTTKVTEHVVEKTLTMTLGTGSTASAITTVIHSTVYQTVTVPCETEGPKATATGSSGKENGNGNQVPKPELTTTTTATSTGTITKTVHRASSTETVKAAKPDSGNGKSTGEGEGSCECAPEKTITVTQPASTVYVTVVPEPSVTNAANAKPTGVAAEKPKDNGAAEKPKGNGADDKSNQGESNDDDEDSDEDDYCEEEATTTAQATVTVVPYPVNGTLPTSGYAAPTGFARRLR